MRKNNIGRQAGITKGELLTHLERSGRPGFTKRRLTQLVSEKLLPSPRRTAQAGTNRPVYVWEPEIIKRATTLYDLLEQKIAHHQLFLALWLVGYDDVPFEPILQRWIQPIDALLHNLTGGAQDPEEALCQLSELLVGYMEPKWKFSPRPDEVIHAVGIGNWRGFVEFIFAVLAVPSYELDEAWAEELQGTIQKMNSIAQSNADPKELLSWVISLGQIFTLPRYRETLMVATVEEWVQARDDYLSICRLLRQLAALFPRRNEQLTPEIRQALFLDGGSKLLPYLLALRCAGYGDRIDEVYTIVSELLKDIRADPAIRKVLARM